jgi:hypothetical protein
MICGVLADKIDYRYVRPICIVQIRRTISQTRAKVQEGTCRLFRHAAIAIGGSGSHAFEETKDAAHSRCLIKSSDQMNFRSAGVGETRFNPSGYQGANQTFCTIHLDKPTLFLVQPVTFHH